MKRVIIGGFLALIGAVGTVGFSLAASADLTSSWTTPPGRLMTTMLQNGLFLPAALFFLLLALGLLILGIEYWKKDS